MPISIFHHETLSHYRERPGTGEFGHTFGGDPSSFGLRFVNCEPLHLLYRLNQADPAVRVGLPGVNWLPLVYHFSYVGPGELIYRVVNDVEIELIAPTEAVFDPDFPYPNYPQSFPESSLVFRKEKYDPTIAEDAVKLAAVFGVDQLSDSEMKRAVEIAEHNGGTISDWGKHGIPGRDFPDWSPEELVRNVHREPFFQGAPLKRCENPDCTAEIEFHAEELTVQMGDEYRELTGESSLTIPAHDVRRKSMRVFALHQPDAGDCLIWGDDPFVQLIFDICERCHCIRVTNQCT